MSDEAKLNPPMNSSFSATSPRVQTVSHGRTSNESCHRVFRFAPRQKIRGVLLGLAGFASLGLGVFLLAQIKATPGLKSQLILMGLILSVCAFVSEVIAVRSMFGRLIIDEEGISIRPSVTGYTITWNKLERWGVKIMESPHLESPCAQFWIVDHECPVFIPYGWLTANDRKLLHETLQAWAPEQEMISSRLVLDGKSRSRSSGQSRSDLVRKDEQISVNR